MIPQKAWGQAAELNQAIYCLEALKRGAMQRVSSHWSWKPVQKQALRVPSPTQRRYSGPKVYRGTNFGVRLIQTLHQIVCLGCASCQADQPGIELLACLLSIGRVLAWIQA